MASRPGPAHVPIDAQDTARRPGRRRDRSATSCSSAPATSAAPPPASGPGCRSARRSWRTSPASCARRWTPSAARRSCCPRCCPRSRTRPAAAGRSTATCSSASRTARAPTTSSAPPTRRSSPRSVKDQCTSYKDLPVILYQIQTKYRDEARPRSGVLRGREFQMKDSYSFDTTDEGLAESYALHREAYTADLRAPRPRLPHRLRRLRRDGRLGLRGVPGARRGRRGHLRGLPELRLRGQHRGGHVQGRSPSTARRTARSRSWTPPTPRPSRPSPRTSASRPPPP